MHALLRLLACLACVGGARRVVPSKPAAAFVASTPGAHAPLRNHRGAARHPVMSEATAEAVVETPKAEIEDKANISAVKIEKEFDIKDMAGISAPLGFFDPVGFTTYASEGRIRFLREVELKHGRVGMLAALGILVAEQFHPMWGGNIDVPAYIAFQETPLQTYWYIVLFMIVQVECLSILSFNSPMQEPWSIKSSHQPGRLFIGFDPLGITPRDKEKLKMMQTKELNNGRLAMLAAAGMIAQELVTGEKLFR
mmetsp:Transcript_104816/g.182196  ORF Transcript_104816/g.182196 Transcript_104816/m.182196 type:complete len:253 (-) Transcript_104816:168-926(-)